MHACIHFTESNDNSLPCLVIIINTATNTTTTYIFFLFLFHITYLYTDKLSQTSYIQLKLVWLSQVADAICSWKKPFSLLLCFSFFANNKKWQVMPCQTKPSHKQKRKENARKAKWKSGNENSKVFRTVIITKLYYNRHHCKNESRRYERDSYNSCLLHIAAGVLWTNLIRKNMCIWCGFLMKRYPKKLT